MATERLTVRIGANLTDFERQMSKMQGSLNRVDSNMQIGRASCRERV